jgi:hypothetical protein
MGTWPGIAGEGPPLIRIVPGIDGERIEDIDECGWQGEVERGIGVSKYGAAAGAINLWKFRHLNLSLCS